MPRRPRASQDPLGLPKESQQQHPVVWLPLERAQACNYPLPGPPRAPKRPPRPRPLSPLRDREKKGNGESHAEDTGGGTGTGPPTYSPPPTDDMGDSQVRQFWELQKGLLLALDCHPPFPHLLKLTPTCPPPPTPGPGFSYTPKLGVCVPARLGPSPTCIPSLRPRPPRSKVYLHLSSPASPPFLSTLHITT